MWCPKIMQLCHISLYQSLLEGYLCNFVYNTHGLVFLIMFNTCHIIIDFLEIFEYKASFVFTSWVVPQVSCVTKFHKKNIEIFLHVLIVISI
jgi:hypothetical protein